MFIKMDDVYGRNISHLDWLISEQSYDLFKQSMQETMSKVHHFNIINFSRPGRDCIEVEFTTSSAISGYHH